MAARARLRRRMVRPSSHRWLRPRARVSGGGALSGGAESSGAPHCHALCPAFCGAAALCPRNDLESLGYLLVACLGGEAALPWHAERSLQVRSMMGGLDWPSHGLSEHACSIGHEYAWQVPSVVRQHGFAARASLAWKKNRWVTLGIRHSLEGHRFTLQLHSHTT